MGLSNRLIHPDVTPRMTYANIGVFSPCLFADVSVTLHGGRAALFPWLYEAARAGRVSGEVYHGRWWNAGTPDDLAQLDANVMRLSSQTSPDEIQR